MSLSSLRAFLKAHKTQTALSIFAAVATLLAGIGLMTHSGYLISRAALRPPILDLLLIIVGVRFFALSRSAFRYLERLVSHDLTFKWLMQLRAEAYRWVAPLMPGLLLRERSGDVLGRLVSDVDTLQNLYLRVVAPVIAAALVVGVTVAALSTFSPLLALTAFLFLALNGIGVPWFITRRAHGIGRQQIEARAQLNAELVESIQGAADLLMLGRERDAQHAVMQQDMWLAQHQTQQARLTGLQDAFSHGCAHLGMWTVLLLALPMVLSGQINGVWLATLTLGVLTSFDAVQALGMAFQFHEQSTEAGARLERLRAEQASLPVKLDLPIMTFDIRFDRVSFAYEEAAVLQDISFTIHEGKRIALVGPSGVGKSTIAQLLLGFQTPDRGKVQIGGHDIQSGSLSSIVKHIAVVPQHTHVFNSSIRDNLTLARPAADEDILWHALEQVRLADWVRGLPEQLDTLIGEQGARISGGERQRVAIARAMLKDAPIWVLDEPTSHLDAQTEREIIDQLLTVTTNRTTLWITHRLLRMDAMDHLLVMMQGRIVERGMHTKLIEANAHYADMVRQQNQWLTCD